MIVYKEYEQKVYDWLNSKNKLDPKFTFSLRQKASKGSEEDYFIGTEKSRYFGTTFWTIPVGFPGSSSDCIDLIFKFSEDYLNYSYNFELTQTNNPDPGQNTSVLNLIKSLATPFEEKVGVSTMGKSTNSMFTIKSKPKKNSYSDLDEMLRDIDADMEIVIPLIDEYIAKEKDENPAFIAYRITPRDFSSMKSKHKARVVKYSSINDEKRLIRRLGLIGYNDAIQLYSIFDTIVSELGIKEGDQRICYNLPKNNLIGITIGQRYCVNIAYVNKENTYNYIDTSEGDENWYQRSDSLDELKSNLDVIVESSRKELDKTSKTSYEDSSSKSLETSIFNADFRKTIFSKAFGDENEELIEEEEYLGPLNQILYGPPGTGKTFITRDKSVEIANSSFEIDEERTGLNEEYERLIKEGNILFTTFHQSMSYEDFIEGIKPDFNPESSKLSYSIIPGVFKRACAQAAYNCYLKANKAITEQRSYDFDDVYDAYIAKVAQHIQDKDFLICKTIQGSEVEIFKLSRTGSIRARAKGSDSTHVAPLTKENIQKLYDRFDSITEIENLQQVKETVEVSPRITEFYAVFKSLKEFEKEFSPSSEASEVKSLVGLEQEEILKKFEAGVFNSAASKFGSIAQPVVLIIDEINRGNVSGIFGELITLLEEDKRKGSANELSVLLPYSQKDFYVPQNLYLIGTMNTADRSVEALDTALRRRFSFEEMMPKPELIDVVVKGFSLKHLLETINERIEVLVDRDHTIGHSYFMGVDTIEALKVAFHNKIIPLLQEYFYGDYRKMEMVIGPLFFNKINKERIVFATNFDGFEQEGEIYKLMNVSKFSDVQMTQSLAALKPKNYIPEPEAEIEIEIEEGV